MTKIKKEIRILGIDDSPFDRFKNKTALVVATVFRGGSVLDGVLSTRIKIDGEDSTSKISRMIINSRHKHQIQLIMLDGIAFGGFNIIDIKALSEKTSIPVLTHMRVMPDMNRFQKALKNVSKHGKKIEMISNAGEVHEIQHSTGTSFCQFVGIESPDVKKILDVCCVHSIVPEPIRAAHIIASGITQGESKGRA